MSDEVRKPVKTYVIEHSNQICQNKILDSIIPSMRTSKIKNGRLGQLSRNSFFDPSTPSMRKVDDGEKKETKRK